MAHALSPEAPASTRRLLRRWLLAPRAQESVPLGEAWLVNVSGVGKCPFLILFGDFEHHLQTSVGIHIPNSWVMFNWDIYQPLILTSFFCGISELDMFENWSDGIIRYGFINEKSSNLSLIFENTIFIRKNYYVA